MLARIFKNNTLTHCTAFETEVGWMRTVTI